MKASKLSESKMRISTYVISIALLLLISIFVGSLSFNQSPNITPDIPYTNNNITCTWTVSPDTTQVNVSWYNNGVLFRNETTTENHSTVSYEDITKNETWVCNVTITNGTDTTSSSDSVYISNSAPAEPSVFNTSGNDIGSFQIIYEDQVYYYDINSSDLDNDTLTYRVSPTTYFCTTTNENTGTVTCSPNASYLDPAGYQETTSQREIKFWADDNDSYYPRSTGHTVTFNITPVNDAPYFNFSLTDKSANETQTFNYIIYGRDEENNVPFTFNVSVNPTLNLTASLLGESYAVIMYGNNSTLPTDSSGAYEVNVTIYDSFNAISSETFTLTVNETNVNPVLDYIPTQNGTQGQPFLFYVYANDSDAADTLNFNISLSQSCSVSSPWTITTVNDSYNNATGLINVSILTNNHVICRNVRITVFEVGDAGAGDYQDVFLNISNTNDPPNVEVLSSYSNNTGGNNISSQVAYAESPYIYQVNATDIDLLTYASDSLAFSDNTTLFNISSTGLITFTPTQGQVENYTINITVNDSSGAQDSGILSLEIIFNSAPVLTSIGDISCAEDILCFLVINATDSDSDDLNFTSNNTAQFNLTNNNSQSPVLSAYLNYTPNQSFVGTHSVIVTVTDIRGAYDNEAILFTINNTNDAPELQSFSFPSIIAETHPVSFYIFADDDDYGLPSEYGYIDIGGTFLTEYVNFSVANISGKNLFGLNASFNTSSNKTYTIATFTPQIGDAGNYSVNISARDYAGAINWTVKNFTVLPKANPPNITQVMPYGRPVNTSTVFSFISTSYFNDSTITSVNFSENRSVIYNISVTDEVTATEDLDYYWLINGIENSTSSYLNISYNFFSQGAYNITVIVANERYENSSWTWNVTVDDLNRNPLLMNSLRNLSNITGTTQDNDYLMQSGSDTHFIDPDDEVINDSNHEFDDGEGSSLTYNVTECSVASIAINNHTIRVTPSEVGSCIVFFTASDSGGLTNTSNPVTINVTEVSNSTTEREVSRSSGGGGSSTSRPIVTPIKQEEEKPKPIEIVVPNLVTIYENKTVLVPVTIKNTWNSSLKGVSLNASSNSSDISLKLTEYYFEEILTGEKRDVTLMVENYRLGENYEVKIEANVTNPLTSDSAIIMLNTIEQAESGPDVETKVTFAQDLLRENPECIELNELLERAKTEISTGTKQEASRMVDAVINGCKYMVSISKKAEQQPQSVASKFLNPDNLKYLLMFLGAVMLTLVSVFVLKKKKASATKEPKKEGEAGEDKKEEVKPYWPGSND